MSLTSYQAAPPRNLALSIGGAGGSRTHNPQIRSLMLYPVELQPQSKTVCSILFFLTLRKGGRVKNPNPKMVISNGSAKKRGRPWGSTKKKSMPRHPHGGGRRRRRKTPTASRKSCMMGTATQTIRRKTDAMSRRKHAKKTAERGESIRVG